MVQVRFGIEGLSSSSKEIIGQGDRKFIFLEIIRGNLCIFRNAVIFVYSSVPDYPKYVLIIVRFWPLARLFEFDACNYGGM
jgi:hypothetical protein